VGYGKEQSRITTHPSSNRKKWKNKVNGPDLKLGYLVCSGNVALQNNGLQKVIIDFVFKAKLSRNSVCSSKMS